MKYIISIVTSITALAVLSGCVATNIVGVSDTSFTIDFSQKKINEREDPTFIIRQTPQLAGKCTDDLSGKASYLYWSGQCRFGQSPPQKIEIQYAKWKPYYQIPVPMDNYITQYGNSLPASAWQTYTIYPKQIMAEVKNRKNPDNTPFTPKVVAKKSMMVFLDINANGNVTLRDDAQYGYTNNVEAYR